MPQAFEIPKAVWEHFVRRWDYRDGRIYKRPTYADVVRDGKELWCALDKAGPDDLALIRSHHAEAVSAKLARYNKNPGKELAEEIAHHMAIVEVAQGRLLGA
jgi:hypothetical protein